MNMRGFVGAAACRDIVLASCAITCLTMLSPAGIVAARAASPTERSEALADTEHTNKAPQVAATDSSTVSQATEARATGESTSPIAVNNATTTADHARTSDEPQASDKPQVSDKPTVETASTNSSEILPTETPPAQAATAGPTDQASSATAKAVDTVEVLDECFVVETCIDRYLWALYQHTPKEDTIKLLERRKVAVRKKRKMVTVTRTFVKLVDEDFAWKDPKAADKVGMTMADYVIGGMDRGFKLKLFHTLHAAEEAGLSPGITSAFRDDYRQSIASGLKAATNRSYHGGSFRGGYGHGLAADIVSVKGETRAQRWLSTEKLWKWVDEHGKEFGIGRPYLDRDPPHVAPVDGQEYAAHNRGTTVQRAALDTKNLDTKNSDVKSPDVKKQKRLAARDERSPAKRSKSVKSSKVGKIRSAGDPPSRSMRTKLHG